MNPESTSDEGAWHEVLATVTACRYEAGAGRAFAFGIPTIRHFRISYNYFADNKLHTGEFRSAKAIPQGTLFPIRYNPDAPHQNSHNPSISPRNSRAPLLTLGILGSIVLTLAWAAILHGCH